MEEFECSIGRCPWEATRAVAKADESDITILHSRNSGSWIQHDGTRLLVLQGTAAAAISAMRQF
jgi:hypothetical protein